MFDETKDVWIKIYKAITIFLFFAVFIGWFIAGCILAKEKPIFILVGLIAGAISAFTILASNMLILNYLKNVQIIRQNVETMCRR